jgi:Domain of unknown function DUF29
MAADGELYHSDFVAWAQAQAHALRSAAHGANLPIDWENVAEEIESLARSERRELISRVSTIIRHLLKLTLSPAETPRRSWVETVLRSRDDIDEILAASPSLRPELPALIAQTGVRAARGTARLLEEFGEMTPDMRARLRTTTFTPEQVLGDWLPEAPG